MEALQSPYYAHNERPIKRPPHRQAAKVAIGPRLIQVSNSEKRHRPTIAASDIFMSRPLPDARIKSILALYRAKLIAADGDDTRRSGMRALRMSPNGRQ